MRQNTCLHGLFLSEVSDLKFKMRCWYTGLCVWYGETPSFAGNFWSLFLFVFIFVKLDRTCVLR